MKLSSIIITLITPLDASLQPSTLTFRPSDPCYETYQELMTVRGNLNTQTGQVIRSADNWINLFKNDFALFITGKCRDHACKQVFNDIKMRLLKFDSDKDFVNLDAFYTEAHDGAVRGQYCRIACHPDMGCPLTDG